MQRSEVAGFFRENRINRKTGETVVNDVAFITTSKGRLHHIKETLPLMLAEGPAEVVVVDYGCPDQTGKWVEENHPEVKVVRVEDDPGFCLPRARNIGAKNSRSPWLVFIDADVKVSKGWHEWMTRHLMPGNFYRAAPVDGVHDKETWGTFVCERKSFDWLGGYDEVYRGWGGEDDDIYLRLRRNGISEMQYPAGFVTAIRHGDEERLAWHDTKSREIAQIVNQLYRAAKSQLMAFQGRERELGRREREQIMKQIKLAVHEWGGAEEKAFPDLVFRVKSDGWLPGEYVMRKELAFRISIDKK